MDPVGAIWAALHLPPKVVINQAGKIDKVRNSSSWKYITESILDVIKSLEGGTQPPQTTAYSNHNPRSAPRSVGFGYSSGYTSGSPSYNPTKDPSLVPIINTSIGPSKNSTKYPSPVSKQLQITQPNNASMEYPSRDPTGALSTMSTEKKSSIPRVHSSSYPDVLKRWIKRNK